MYVLIFNRNTGYKRGSSENSALTTLGSLNSVSSVRILSTNLDG